MAVVFQEYGRSLYPWLTVRGNVELPLKHQNLSTSRTRPDHRRRARRRHLGHAHHSYPWQLSGGMQQRVAIARAVAYHPEVLIMDEPFAAVDAQTRADLEDLVRTLHRERGMSILFVTHDIDESVYLGERVIVLSNSPTWVQEDVPIDLASDRDQITTRALPRFTELRTHVYTQVQRAKRGEAYPTGQEVVGRGPAVRTRKPAQLLLAFFGDMVMDRHDDPVPAPLMLDVLEGADVAPATTRATLNRMAAPRDAHARAQGPRNRVRTDQHGGRGACARRLSASTGPARSTRRARAGRL